MLFGGGNFSKNIDHDHANHIVRHRETCFDNYLMSFALSSFGVLQVFIASYYSNETTVIFTELLLSKTEASCLAITMVKAYLCTLNIS